jgi:hypothetical protein
MKCPNCREWDELERPCTAESHGECDCPKCTGICNCDDEEEKPKFWCVSVYEVSKHYGGPEEGGWWWDRWDPSYAYALQTRVFNNFEKAHDYEHELQEWCDMMNAELGLRELSSVLSTYVLRANIDENAYPTVYPKERPHYE